MQLTGTAVGRVVGNLVGDIVGDFVCCLQIGLVSTFGLAVWFFFDVMKEIHTVGLLVGRDVI
jgi:hypothetical protein